MAVIHTRPEELKQLWNKYSNPEVVVFYSQKDRDLGCFSNFYNHSEIQMTIPEWCGIFGNQCISFNFSEKAIMLCKASLMGDKESFKLIMKAQSPIEAKHMGRKVTPFDQNKWNKYVCSIAKAVIIAKFSQLQKEKKTLISTNNSLIAEASRHDNIWGIGMGVNHPYNKNPLRWKGTNILGWALMEAREYLKNRNGN